MRNHDELSPDQLSDRERDEVFSVLRQDPDTRIHGRGPRRPAGAPLSDNASDSVIGVDLRPVDADNWQACAAIRPAPGQERFVASVAFYLCLCHYERTWRPLAVCSGADVVGHVMWAVDPDDGSYWIGGLVIDAQRQGQGYGREAVASLLQRFRDAGAVEAALSYRPENAAARALYATLGFRETGERTDGEVVARMHLR